MERAERRANRRKELENNKSNAIASNGFKAVTIETNLVANGDSESIAEKKPVVSAKTESNKKVEVSLNTNGLIAPIPEDKKTDVPQENSSRSSDDLLARRAERRRMRLAAEEEKIKARTEKPVESSNVETTTKPTKVVEINGKDSADSGRRFPSKKFDNTIKDSELNGKPSLRKVDLTKQTDDKMSSLRKTNFDSKPPFSRNRPGSTAVDFKAKFETNGTVAPTPGVDSLKKRPVSMNVRSKFEAASNDEQKPVKFELRKTTSVPPKSAAVVANKFEGQSRLNKVEKKNELVEKSSTTATPKTNGFAHGTSTERSVTKTESSKTVGSSKNDIKEMKVVEKKDTKTTTTEKTTTVTETKTTTPKGTLTTKKTETKLESSSKPGLKKTDSKSK